MQTRILESFSGGQNGLSESAVSRRFSPRVVPMMPLAVLALALASCGGSVDSDYELDPYVPPDHVGDVRDWLTDVAELAASIEPGDVESPGAPTEPLHPMVGVRGEYHLSGDSWNTVVVSEADWNALRRLPERGEWSTVPRDEAVRSPETLFDELLTFVEGGETENDGEVLAKTVSEIRYVVLLRNLRMPQTGRVTVNLGMLLADPSRRAVQNALYGVTDLNYTRCITTGEALVFDLTTGKCVAGVPLEARTPDQMSFHEREEGDERAAEDVYQEQLERNAWTRLVFSLTDTLDPPPAAEEVDAP